MFLLNHFLQFVIIPISRVFFITSIYIQALLFCLALNLKIMGELALITLPTSAYIKKPTLKKLFGYIEKLTITCFEEGTQNRFWICALVNFLHGLHWSEEVCHFLLLLLFRFFPVFLSFLLLLQLPSSCTASTSHLGLNLSNELLVFATLLVLQSKSLIL